MTSPRELAFNFEVPTRVMFGMGSSRRIVEVTQRRGVRRVLLITDRGVMGAGLVEPVVKDLESVSVEVVVYDRISPNPRDSEVDAGAAIGLAESCDHIVAVGGGSPIDCAKGISVVMAMGGSIRDYDHHPRISDRATPVIAIPTTAGTGSEVTVFAVITDTNRNHKMAFGGGPVAPRVALVDPGLTLSLPPGCDSRDRHGRSHSRRRSICDRRTQSDLRRIGFEGCLPDRPGIAQSLRRRQRPGCPLESNARQHACGNGFQQ